MSDEPRGSLLFLRDLRVSVVNESGEPLSDLAEHVHELGHLLPLLLGVAALDGVFDTMRDVVLQHLFLDPLQSRAHGLDLGDDVDAVAVVLDHADETAHLPLDAAQARYTGILDFASHGSKYTPRGYPVQGRCSMSDHLHSHDHNCGHGAHHAHEPAPALAKDPVCGMTVNPATAKHKASHGGVTYFFCNPRCRETFEAYPQRYVSPAPAPAPAPAAPAAPTALLQRP